MNQRPSEENLAYKHRTYGFDAMQMDNSISMIRDILIGGLIGASFNKFCHDRSNPRIRVIQKKNAD